MHTLDPVITRLGELNILDLQCDDSVHSDHSAVIFRIPLPKADLSQKRVQIRKWRNINLQSFVQDIRSSDLAAVHSASSAAAAVQIYDTSLSTLLDKHAPAINRVITIRHEVPWYNTQIKLAKALRRQFELQWRRTSLAVHKQLFTEQRNLVTKLCAKAKK